MATKERMEGWIRLLKIINRHKDEHQMAELINYLILELKKFEADKRVKREQEQALKSMKRAIENYRETRAVNFKKAV